MRAYFVSVIFILSAACASTNGNLVKPVATQPPDEPAFNADVDSDVQKYVPVTVRLMTAEHADFPYVTPVVSVDSMSIFRDEYFLLHWNDTETPPAVTWYPRLIGELMFLRTLWLKLHPGKEFPGVIGLAIDKVVPLTVVRSLVASATVAGFPTVSFYVRHRRAPQHIGVLHVDGRAPVFRGKIDWTKERYASLAVGPDQSVGYAWFEGDRILDGVRGTNTTMLGDVLREAFAKFARHQAEHDRGINWVCLDADGTLPIGELVPVLDAIQVPRRKFRRSDGRVVETKGFWTLIAVDEKDIVELWRSWPTAKEQATRIAEELLQRVTGPAPHGASLHE